MPTDLVIGSPNSFTTPRPPARGIDVTTTLADFAMVTFAVDPDRLARLLPEGFEPDVFRLDSGEQRAFVSAVPFRDLDFRFAFFPWLRFSFCQTNYRAYVRYRGQRGVWFFGTTLDTRWVAIPRNAWRLPWHRARFSMAATWDGERCERYRLQASGPWGGADAELEGSQEPTGRLDGFADAEETALVLTHPLIGYFRRRDGKRGYSVWHDRLKLKRGIARKARFEVFENLGLVAPDQIPHSVLIQQKTEFVILLPPRLLMEPQTAARPLR